MVEEEKYWAIRRAETAKILVKIKKVVEKRNGGKRKVSGGDESFHTIMKLLLA